MSEQVEVKPEGAEMANANVQVGIQKIYTKDVSFESPNVSNIFTQQNFKPEIKMEMNSKSTKAAEDIYEVTLKITLTATDGETVAFLVEVEQAGLFSIKGLEDAQLAHFLSTFAPESLYPYSREVITGLVQKGGFPPVYLAPVNFDALYRSQLEQQAAAQQQAAAPTVQ
ncbi:MAG: protein-export chaperone SecB [Kangiellaceae bacterium]|jgi:preprotein translocase subunit SecB|nr:protein-export chaperone SecB [Kangiellaceae bacterium]